MIIFTPNTVIKSTEVNSNFSEAIDSTAHTNNYKFSVHRSTALTPGAADVLFNTELYDSNNNYDPATGKYTVPVTGYYQFNASLVFDTTASGLGYSACIKKNGTAIVTSIGVMMYSGAYSHGFVVNKLEYCTAGDYITVADIANCGRPLGTAISSNSFNGFFVSK